MPSMKVTVVDVVDVIAVRYRDMPAPVAVNMVMAGVLAVSFVAHGFATVSEG
jgi:hypothetical protein